MMKLWKKKIGKYFSRLGTAISVLLNVLIGGNSNQTLSARNYERMRNGQVNFVWLIDKIFWFDPMHCLMSWCYWKVRKDVIHDEAIEEKFKNYDG